MNEREQAALAAILASKKYREICPETVERVFLQKLEGQKNIKEADKAARAQLHQITGAFLGSEDLVQAGKLALAYAEGDAEALDKALLLHASTRERAASWRALYARAFRAMGGIPSTVNDYACGLNPLALGALGIEEARGWDIQGGAARTVNEWARATGWNLHAECADLMTERQYPQADVALYMKLLPLLERQKTGAGARAIAQCGAEYALVTFPTRTLGGRNVGMAAQYAHWMEQNAPTTLRELDRFQEGDELAFVYRRI